MADYPSIGLRFSARPETQRTSNMSDAGTVRTVDLSDNTVFEISITHPLIDSTDRDTLLTFYTDYRDSFNAITLGGFDYEFQFESGYEISSDNGTLVTMKTVISAVKQ